MINTKVISTNNSAYGWKDLPAADAENGTMEIIINETTYTVKISEDGKWSFTPPDGWDQGLHTVQWVIVDDAGNRSEATTFIVNVDATAPVKPEIWRVVDNKGTDVGNLTPGEMTDETKPVVSGVAEPGSIVYLYDNAAADPIASVKVDSMGAWTITPELEDGAHSLTVISQDAAKNSSVKSDAFTLTVDAGVVTQAANTASDAADEGAQTPAPLAGEPETSGIAPNKINYINKNVIEQKGDLGPEEAGTVLQIILNDVTYTVKADAEGKWQFKSPVLEDGMYVYQIRALDEADNWGDASQIILQIETSAPEAPQVMRVIDNEGDTKYLSSGDYTNDKTPTIYGVAQPDALVYIFGTGSTAIGSVTAGADGRWSYELTLSTDGTHIFSANYVDRFKQTSAKSENFSLILDTKVPSAPSLSSVMDDEGRVTGEIKAGSTTDDKTPTLSGSADSGTIVIVYDGDKIIGSTVASARGLWKLEVTLEDGEHSLRVESVSLGGNSSGKTPEFKFIVDSNLLPPAQIEEVIANNTGTDIPLKSGDSTNDTTPVLRGSGTDGDIVYVMEDGKAIASTVVTGGKWSIEIPEQEEGSHEFTVEVEDATGKRSPGSDPVVIVIDETAPDKPSQPGIVDKDGDNAGPVNPGTPIDDNKPEFGGDGATPGDIVEIIIIGDDGEKEVIGSAKVGDDGKWVVTPVDPIGDGEYDVIVEITDPAGNTSEPSDPIKLIIDTEVPEALAGYELIDNVGPITGPIKAGDMTDDTRPTLTGTAEAGSQVIVSQDGSEIARVTVGADGTWSYELPTIAEGAHTITVQPVSESGVKGPISDEISFTVDTTAPAAGSVTFDAVYKDNNTSETLNPITNGKSNDNTLIMQGTGNTDGLIVVVYGDAAKTMVLGSAVVQSGKWEFETPQLADSPKGGTPYQFNIGFRDAAGNETALAKTVDVEIDTVAPPKPPVPTSFIEDAGESLMTMSINDILAQGNDSLFIDNGKTQLLVTEEAGKELQLEDILPEGESVDNWSQANGTVTVAGVEYNVYQNTGGEAEVLVPQHLMQEQQ